MANSIWKMSAEALRYVQARPSHPREIVLKCVDFLNEKYKEPLYQAVDIGCGTGISTVNLIGHFQSVVGLDASEAMIEQATKQNLHGSVRFLVSSAENLAIESNSTQLLLAGRSIHYFDPPKFFQEVDRVLVDGGVVCYYSVHFPTISSPNVIYGEDINAIFWKYLTVKLEDCWPVNPHNGEKVDWQRRKYYVDVLKAPYPESRVDETVTATRDISVLQLAKELETYSAFVIYREKHGDSGAEELINQFLSECRQVGEEQPMIASDNFFMVMSRKPIS